MTTMERYLRDARYFRLASILAVALGCGSPAIQDAHAALSRPAGPAAKILAAAKAQLSHPATYTGEYFSIAYPNGDVPANRGACVDVIIRALRPSGYDLQKLIHEDMAHDSGYPRRGARRDSNIDHRRVPNQRHYFEKYGLVLTTKADRTTAAKWKPGDIVTWKLDGGLDHTGIISDRRNSEGLPWVIHNIGPQVAEADVLTSWRITGHYRFPK